MAITVVSDHAQQRTSRAARLAPMTRKALGTIHDNTVLLDEPLPDMEGQRVEVELRVVSAEDAPQLDELRRAWTDWAQGANQGPIVDESESWP